MSEIEDTLKREPRQPVTADVIEKTNAALEAANGSAVAAAKILDVPPRRVHNIINSTPALKARWGLAAGDVKLDVVARPPLPESLTASPVTERAISLGKVEKNLAKSLSTLGFSPSEVKSITSVEEFAGQHFQASLRVLHGNMVQSSIRLGILAERIYHDYLCHADDLDPKDLDHWYSRYFLILENLRASSAEATKSALTNAVIALKKKESQMGPRAGKPGFTPTPMVNINLNGQQPEKRV